MRSSVPVIASGGVGTLDHLVDGVREGHASAVLAASIFHFGDHTIGEAKRHMASAGIPDADGLRAQSSSAARSPMRPAIRVQPPLMML